MIKKLQIEDFEDKKTASGKGYTRFKTSEGWMSCFDTTTSMAIKKLVGNPAELEIKESNVERDGKITVFSNIVKLINGVVSKDTPQEIKKVSMEIKGGTSRDASFYTAYAKDIFVALLDVQKGQEIFAKEDMELAINLIKQARDAF